MIIIENKHISETPLECINRLRKDNKIPTDIKATYAGRLDPMAEGLMIILTDTDIKNKERYTGLEKEYEFEILEGIHTDSLDILGIIDKYENKKNTRSINEIDILKYIRLLSKTYKQKYPKYSSKTFEGHQLHSLAKQNIYPEIYHNVDIKKIDYISKRNIKKDQLLDIVMGKINKVNGDFRQKETIEKWQEIIKKIDKDKIFTIYKYKIKVSSGFYIRQLIDDIGAHFKTETLTFSIKRISVGKYSLKNMFFYNIINKIFSLIYKQ